ncbi:MAG: hypothetical protein KBT36_11955 [Kurthia sp.]|nr:hypothetical protein [Candidatus Kurthia equi]
MEHKEMVAFLQKKVKVIGGMALLTLTSVVIVQILRSLEKAHPDAPWQIGIPIFIVIACIMALLLFAHVVHMMYKMFKK